MTTHEQRARDVLRRVPQDWHDDAPISRIASLLATVERETLERAAVRLEARATSEQITADRALASSMLRHGEAARHEAIALTLREEAITIRALGGEQREEVHAVGDVWEAPSGARVTVTEVNGSRITAARGPGVPWPVDGLVSEYLAAGWRRVSRGGEP